MLCLLLIVALILLCSCTYCVYIYLFISMFILLFLVYSIVFVSLDGYCVCIPRWVLDHLLGYVWEVPFGGRNLIPPRHLGMLLLLPFNLCHPIYFQAIPIPFYFMISHLISCTPRLPFILLHWYLYVYIYTISRHLKKK